MSWLRPSNRSARVSFPCAPSNTYCFSTFSQGSSRRCRLSSSRNLVNSFSLRRNSLRAATHSAGDTTFAGIFSIVAVVMIVTPSLSNCFSHLSSCEELLPPAPSTRRLKARYPPPLLRLPRMLDTYPSSLLRLPLGACLDALVDVRPSPSHAAPVLFLNQSERLVVELDHRLAALLAQPVLQVRHDRIRHEQRPGNLKQRGTLDRLHVSPQMSVAVAQIAEPAPAGPGLQLHRHLSLLALVLRPQLLEKRLERLLQRCPHTNLLTHRQGQTLNSR